MGPSLKGSLLLCGVGDKGGGQTHGGEPVSHSGGVQR